MKTLFTIYIVVAALILQSSCRKSNSEETPKSDDITINKQIWMSKNLNVSTFRNGDLIPEAKTNQEWTKAGENKQPAWCYYENDPANGTKYGKLYNWYAVNDARGLASAGYHIPTDSEWSTLINYLGGVSNAGTKMKSTTGWINGNGNNESGFNGLPGGIRGNFGAFNAIGFYGTWWCSVEFNGNTSFAQYLRLYNTEVGIEAIHKEFGYSVRCLRD